MCVRNDICTLIHDSVAVLSSIGKLIFHQLDSDYVNTKAIEDAMLFHFQQVTVFKHKSDVVVIGVITRRCCKHKGGVL